MRLMTFNVNYANPDPGAAVAAIVTPDPDVVLLQEITSAWERPLARLDARYPYRAFRPHRRSAGGLAVFSKLPISSEQVLETPLPGWFPAQHLVLEAPFGPLQILHVHLRPAIDGGSWIKGFLTTPRLRVQEIETYWSAMTDLPTVVAGDFNETSTGLAITFLQHQGLVRVATVGPTTWHLEHTENGTTSEFRLDIDHVMTDASIVCRDGHVIDSGCSDHRPVIVTIERR